MDEVKKPSSYTILEFPPEMRPRERLLASSALNLADYELLAILLRTGTPQLNALDLAQEILRRLGGLHGLKEAHQKELTEIPGVGEGKAAIILAAIEMGRRLQRENVMDPVPINDPRIAAKHFHHGNVRPNQEVFQVLYLDTKLRLISAHELFVGTLDASLVHMRDIFRGAVKTSARALIVGHNHPSGDVHPSRQDIDLTNRLVEAGRLMDILVQDHIIISDRDPDSYFSFKEHALM